MSAAASKERINDFVVKFANVNGTGSASANGLILKTIFRMGVPVVGKNFFPSNIQGLPTWYEVRVTKDGHMARSGRVDVMVAMNPETYAKDIKEVSPGGWLIYDSTFPRPALLARDDVTALGVPLAAICNREFQGVRARTLMKNIVYAGVLAALLDLDLEVIRGLLAETYAKKPALVDSNMKAIQLGYEHAKASFGCPLPARVARSDKTKGQVMIDGNTAAALGCLYAGATVGAWYPITPSTSLMDAFKGFCDRYRTDPATGRKDFAILQAEDELAAIGMVLGASWNGARSFTPTSGPGISLMNEFLGLAYYAEIPAVLFDVQRVGPSTGMPTRTQQCDLLECAYASHGDTKHVLLFPADPAESFELAATAFDLAERLQTPVFVMLDLDLGMNDWMVKEFAWDDSRQPDRGKVLTPEAIGEIKTHFKRYLDPDGDGIPYRTLPGISPKAAFFTRGSGHNKTGGYTEDAHEYQEVVDRLSRKFETAKRLVPPAVAIGDGHEVGILSLGTCDGAVKEALATLGKDGIALDYLRVRGFPFGEEVERFLEQHRQVFVVEQNRDAQLKSLLTLETRVAKDRLKSILHYNGLPIPSSCIVEGVRKALATEAAA